jgi:ribosomal protein L37E
MENYRERISGRAKFTVLKELSLDGALYYPGEIIYLPPAHRRVQAMKKAWVCRDCGTRSNAKVKTCSKCGGPRVTEEYLGGIKPFETPKPEVPRELLPSMKIRKPGLQAWVAKALVSGLNTLDGETYQPGQHAWGDVPPHPKHFWKLGEEPKPKVPPTPWRDFSYEKRIPDGYCWQVLRPQAVMNLPGDNNGRRLDAGAHVWTREPRPPRDGSKCFILCKEVPGRPGEEPTIEPDPEGDAIIREELERVDGDKKSK